MLMTALPRSLPIELMGPMLQGPAEVKGLQQALANLAIATNRPDINPGAIDGTVGAQTVQAVIAASTLISAQLSTIQFAALQAALAAGAMTATAKEAVSAAAVPLTVAANTAAVKYRTTGIMPTGGFFRPGWYTTPMGIALIIGVAFVGWKLFLSSPAPAKAA